MSSLLQNGSSTLQSSMDISDSATLHVTSFIELISDLNVVHEDVMMKMFVLTLEDDALNGLMIVVQRKYLHLQV
jgi:hypothetical protein